MRRSLSSLKQSAEESITVARATPLSASGMRNAAIRLNTPIFTPADAA
jgi:hypothetical protein